MKISSYPKIIRFLWIVVLLFIPTYLTLKVFVFERATNIEGNTTALFVGHESCIDCHLGEYQDWLGSHHDRAMEPANDSTVLGNFSDQTLESQGRLHKMYKKGGRFFVLTDGEDGSMQEFEIMFTFGFTPLQQYLVELDDGRLQALPLTWNTTDNTWYHMADSIYKGEKVNHNNWLHWTNQAQNWNSMCAECHSTNLVKGYDPATESYNTTYSEIDVSCEACHGPGSRHVEWAKLPEYSRSSFENFGLAVKTSGIDQVQYVENCVRCHSRKTSLGDITYHTGSVYDHLVPHLPDEPNWFVDGQILEEDYVYASFLQSKMYEREVKCNDCHNVHSGELLFEGNDLCLQCHQQAIYEDHSHHHHKNHGMDGNSVISESGVLFEIGSGTLCINCHMHGRYYMGVDYRRDHSFRVPRPDLSIKNETPNACNQCHADETNEWSESHLTKWFGPARKFHYSEAFVAAQKNEKEAEGLLIKVLDNDLYPPNIRKLALQDLGNYFPDSANAFVENYLNHLDPGFRVVALQTMQIQSQNHIDLLLSKLNDNTKAVRIEAARRIFESGFKDIPNQYRDLYDKSLGEYREMLLFNSDFPSGKFALANYYYQNGEYKKAEEFYLKTLDQDRELNHVKLNLAHLYNRIKQNGKAKNLFEEYLAETPNDATAFYSYGLLLSEMGNYQESLSALITTTKLAPELSRVNHNIAMMYAFMKDLEKAEYHLLKEIDISDNLNSRLELLRFYLENNQPLKALQFAESILIKYPDANEVKTLVQQLRQGNE